MSQTSAWSVGPGISRRVLRAPVDIVSRVGPKRNIPRLSEVPAKPFEEMKVLIGLFPAIRALVCLFLLSLTGLFYVFARESTSE